MQGLEYRYGKDDEELKKDFNNAKQELQIKNILTKRIFTEDYNLEDSKHPVVSKWEEIVTKYCEKYNVKTE